MANAAGLTGSAQERDTEIAHLTPGEIVVPLHAQTPAVVSALADVLGASLPRYVVGSRITQRNPVSGYSAFAGAATQQNSSQSDPFSALEAAGDFARNYRDMTSANVKDADK